MSKSALLDRKPSTDRTLDALSDAVRREALAVLRDRNSPMAVAELATHLVAAVDEIPLVDVTREDRDALRGSLLHAHLPKLEAVGLVEWDRDRGTVAAREQPDEVDDRLETVLAFDADDPDAVLRALSDARRRHVLAALVEADGALDRETLVRRLVARENDVTPAEVPARELDGPAVSLEHADLPILREAGLVEEDGETVAYAGDDTVDRDLLAFGVVSSPIDDATDQVNGEGPDEHIHPRTEELRSHLPL